MGTENEEMRNGEMRKWRNELEMVVIDMGLQVQTRKLHELIWEVG